MGIVKTFRDFINESSWGEMRHRSSGITKRSEDIVHLENRYKSKFDICLKRFVNFIVYYEKYDNTLDDMIRFIHEDTSVKIWCEIVDGHTVHFPDIIEPYIKDNWNRFDNIEKQVRDLIIEEEKKISETGFKKGPGKTIADTVNDWWDTLDDDTKYDTMMDSSMRDRAEEEFYETHLDDDEFTGEDLDPDEMYDNCPWPELIQIYMDKNTKSEE